MANDSHRTGQAAGRDSSARAGSTTSAASANATGATRGGRVPKALTIAGIDPSGGAGVLADIKTFSALGAYGCGVVCALTAQNTQAVTGIQSTPPDFIRLQLATLFADIAIDAAKIGMLGTAEAAQAVAEGLSSRSPPASCRIGCWIR